MMRRALCLVLLLSLVLFSSAAAQEITITSDQKEYYIQQGAQATIPLVLTNTYGHEVKGTLERTSVGDEGAGPESAVQSASFKIPDGAHSLNLHLGPYDQPMTLTVSLRFAYTEAGVDREVALSPLVVHVTANDPGQKNVKDPLVSTDLPAPRTTVPADQQGQGESIDQALQSGQIPSDAGALQNQFRQEENLTALRQTALEQVIENDSTIRDILASLQVQGFTVDDRQVTPVSNTTGQFLYHFAKKSGEEATLNGGMDNATLLFADQKSSALLSLPPLLEKNATYRAFADNLHGDGYSGVQTDINTTTNRTAVVALTWADRKENKATAAATVINNTTISGLTLHRPPAVPSNLIPMLLALLHPVVLTLLAVLCFAGGVILYRRWRRRRDSALALEVQSPFDYRKAAEDLLVMAAAYYAQGAPQRGYGSAGEALRLFLSYHYGDGTSSTDQEVLALPVGQGADLLKVQMILQRCSLVEFAKWSPDAEEFAGILAAVRGIIRDAGPKSGK
ncbi:hypothetical protein [Methanosphaerula palustris]|uniref:DUF4129 domain-containing protein n=1 Tax=Methanosphaerula palustris (strain ATCC BAA-1556 / DSM 19958 / E1-9c) TaxID=521011 RepID=B8GK40_METPE|nr:hypothetical protein [Methanosphaerula palustris]ACL17111.1 hypothetical protein Mpal_1805 [Methanosphaerula palustris E1-9c]